MRTFPTLAAAALAATAVVPLHAQEVPTVAVMDLTAFSVSLEDAAAVGRGLATMITTELDEHPGVDVVDRQAFEEIMRRQQVSVGATGISEDAALQIGRLLGAQYIVLGSAALDPRRARLDLRMVDVETAVVIKSVKETGERDALLELAERVAALLATDLEMPERPTMARVEIPVASSLAYSRGLDYERRGRRDRAAEMYRRALQLFPEHPHAQAALARVR